MSPWFPFPSRPTSTRRLGRRERSHSLSPRRSAASPIKGTALRRIESDLADLIQVTLTMGVGAPAVSDDVADAQPLGKEGS